MSLVWMSRTCWPGLTWPRGSRARTARWVDWAASRSASAACPGRGDSQLCNSEGVDCGSACDTSGRCPNRCCWQYGLMETGTGQRLISHYTTDVEQYLDRVGAFLRRRPVEHSVLLSTVTTRVGDEVAGEASNLWLWVEDDKKVVAAAQLTPPYGAYLSTGPAEAMRELARPLWRLWAGLPGAGG